MSARSGGWYRNRQKNLLAFTRANRLEILRALLHAVLLGLIVTLAILVTEDLREEQLRWLVGLTGLPAQVLSQPLGGPLDLHVPGIALALQPPDTFQWLLNLGAGVIVFLLARYTPPLLCSALRLLAGFHVLAVVAGGLLAPQPDVLAHTTALSRLATGLVLVLPCWLALTHSVLEGKLTRRLGLGLLCAAWLLLALPLKLMMHLLLIRDFGSLAMPSLFLLAGPAPDLLGIVALQAWALSRWGNPD